MTLQELIEQSYSLAKEKGWHDQPRSVAEALCLIHSEVSEALEEIRAGHDPKAIFGNMEWGKQTSKPTGFSIELADVAIRLADFCGDLGIEFHSPERSIQVQKLFCCFYEDDSATDMLHKLHVALVEVHRTIDFGFPARNAILVVFDLVGGICHRFGIDLEEAVRIKHEYNKTRPYRHGKKV